MVKFGCTSLGDISNGIITTVNCGLDCYEYAASHGSYTNKSSISSHQYKIPISIHGPFYITLTNPDKLSSNLNQVINAVHYAKLWGADKIVVHTSCSKCNNRITDLKTIINTLNIITSKIDMGNIKLAIENIGKVNLTGGVDDVIMICSRTSNTIPCIDIGHLYSRSLGKVNKYSDYMRMFDDIVKYLGNNTLNNIHYHYSNQLYGDKGEIRHLNLSDQSDLNPLEFIKALKQLGNECSSRVICESRNDLIKDALVLKQLYKEC